MPNDKIVSDDGVRYASFGRRTVAFLLDVLPLTFATGVIFYVYLGFDDILQEYVRRPRNPDTRSAFVEQRNQIRFFAGALYVVYTAMMQASPWQGTIGKRLVGCRVINEFGKRITTAQS